MTDVKVKHHADADVANALERDQVLKPSVKYTLVIPVDLQNERLFLAKKARGAGKGKYIGFGGKIDKEETADEGAVREMKEETSLTVTEQQLRKIGLILFRFLTNPVVQAEMHVYVIDIKDFDEGQVQLNDEFQGRGRWYDRKEIPLREMWADFSLWCDKCFERKRFRATFSYIAQQVLESHSIENVTDDNDELLEMSRFECM